MRIRTCPILDKLSKDGKEAVTCGCMDYSETVSSRLKLVFEFKIITLVLAFKMIRYMR